MFHGNVVLAGLRRNESHTAVVRADVGSSFVQRSLMDLSVSFHRFGFFKAFSAIIANVAELMLLHVQIKLCLRYILPLTLRTLQSFVARKVLFFVDQKSRQVLKTESHWSEQQRT